jgi:DNA recombination-mediator protein A
MKPPILAQTCGAEVLIDGERLWDYAEVDTNAKPGLGRFAYRDIDLNGRTSRVWAENYLVISQVPVFRYYQQTWKINRHFFPERNITMSALTEANIIVEAGNTSGTLTHKTIKIKLAWKVERAFQS